MFLLNIYLFNILIILFIINIKAQQQFNFPNQQNWQQINNKGGNTDNSLSFRLIDELVGIFAPPRNIQRNEELMPRMARSEDYKAEKIELDSPINNNNENNHQHWESLARGVIDLFKSIETTTPTTTTTTTQMSLLERILPKIFNPFDGTDTTTTIQTSSSIPTLFPFNTWTTTSSPSPSFFSSFFSKEQPKKEAEMRPNQLLVVEPVARLFGVERKAVEEGRAQIDTGGSSFDRFVVRQKSESDNPFASIVGGSKWKERGIKWENGNIRLVDKNGNSLLGTEVGVNDRSLDIPLRRWLEIANGIVNFQQTQREHVRRF